MILGGAGFCPSTVCLFYTNQVIERDLFVSLSPLVGRHLTLFQGSRFHHHQKGHKAQNWKKMEKVIGHQENLDFLDLHLHDILKERYPKQVPASWVGYSRSKNSYFLRWFVVRAMSWIMSDWGFGPAIIWTTKSKKKTWSPLTILGWNRAMASHCFNL